MSFLNNNLQHKIVSIFAALVFVLNGIYFSGSNLVIINWIASVLLFTAAITIYNYLYLQKQDNFSWWLVLRFSLFIFFWFLVFGLIPSLALKIIYLIASGLLVYFFENLIANTGQQFEWNFLLVSLITFLMVVYGLGFYFMIPGMLDFLIMFVGILLIFRVFVHSVPNDVNTKWFVAAVMSLAAVELYWGLQFLPLHYSVLAIIEFNILYLLWSLYYHYLYKTLTIKQIQLSFLVVVAVSVLALLTTPWSIIL